MGSRSDLGPRRDWRSTARSRLLTVFLAIAATAAIFLAPRPALAKSELTIAKLEVPDDTTADFSKKLHRLLKQTAAKLDFGKVKKVEVTIRLTEFTIEQGDDLVRVTGTLVGRLKGGGTAKSHISFGGKPSKRKALEKQVLHMIADSVLTRLAEMSRVREILEERRAKEKEGDGDKDEKADKKEGGDKKHKGKGKHGDGAKSATKPEFVPVVSIAASVRRSAMA